jgi:pimeloyl-ACP methyl ester carboxylesterase
MTTAASGRPSALKKSAGATVNGVRTRTLECAGSGPTVLLLHGFSDSADSWRDVIQLLADVGRRAVAVDLPYFGRAERPAHDSVLDTLDDFVAAAIRQYDTGDGVVLVGNSIGGLIALRAAQGRRPPLLAAVAICPVGLSTPWWMKVVNRTRPITDRLIALPAPNIVRGTVTGPAIIATAFARAVARGRLTPTAKAQYASHWGPGDLRRQLILGGRTIAELVNADVVDLTSFSVPVTLAWGDKDWICPPRATATLRRVRPDVDVRWIRGSGHCPQYDRPDAVTEIILDVVSTATATAKEPAT